MLGAIEPDEGEVLIGGKPINGVDYMDFYKDTSIMLQDYQKYALTVAENVTVGKNGERDNEHLLNLLDSFSLSEKVAKLKDKEETKLRRDFGGIEFSGGEWQSLALARCFYKNPYFVVLDEPTASIDALNEAKIYKSIFKLLHDRTAVIISHRLAIANYVDRIVYLENGEIKEMGTQEELLRNNSSYAKVYRSQADRY